MDVAENGPGAVEGVAALVRDVVEQVRLPGGTRRWRAWWPAGIWSARDGIRMRHDQQAVSRGMLELCDAPARC